MKATPSCIDCLKRLAKTTIETSGGNPSLYGETSSIIHEMYEKRETPPEIANSILRYIRSKTGVSDPFIEKKKKELEDARTSFSHLKNLYRGSLEGAIRLSAIGNSMDHFILSGEDFGYDQIDFQMDMDKIAEAIYINGKDVLILGDNIGDYIFDTPLIIFLKERGKKVYYAVKGHPVQNDVSLKDIEVLGLPNDDRIIISNGCDEVGMKRERITGKIKELWESDSLVIAKGMGNYETISEYFGERPVIHILKVKCEPVGMDMGYKVGTYVAILR
ncbi:MAG: ARMT1-like domain-containing protein [Syntrophorhabdaceae bacterium]|nr:ARMT1-like domain-containing protein [Syntrophorhabdaceae bacterium]